VRNRKEEQKGEGRRTEKKKKEGKEERTIKGKKDRVFPFSGSSLCVSSLSLPDPPFSPTIISVSETRMEKIRNE
jgi:hypothetical protein